MPIALDKWIGRRTAEMRRGAAVLGLSTLCTALTWAQSGQAQTAFDFTGKTITIVVGFPPGGDYDTYARLTANGLGRHLSGNPTVVVQNMPGAGGVAAANYLYNVARRDGTFLGVVAQTAAIADITHVSGVKFDVGQFNWIGRVNSNVEVQQVWHTAPVKTFADLKDHEIAVAGTGSTSSSYIFPNLLNKMFGTKFKVVPGYQGVGMAILAMERGEVAGAAVPWSLIKAQHPEWLRDRKVNNIIQYVVTKHHDLPDVPSVMDIATDDLQKGILGLYASGAEIGRSILAPPSLPEPAVRALRDGFVATLKDDVFLGELKKSGLEFDPLSGSELQSHIRQLLKVSPEVVTEARKLTDQFN
jgi:tripartite-type tricarboxylate transporter receptor subunit TctC